MLTIEAARKIGINACIDKIGREFMRLHKDSAVYACGDGKTEDSVYCYVGADDRPDAPGGTEALVLDDTSRFPYYASCDVRLSDGSTSFIDCVLPA